MKISGLATPVDGDSVTRILRDAVRDDWLVPAIDRTWWGSRHVTRFYAPQSWPKRAPDPKPTVYGMLNGELVPFGPDGYLIDKTPYVPVVRRAAATVGGASSSKGGAAWPGIAEAAAGALLLAGGSDADSAGAPDIAESLTVGDDSPLLGDAQPFDYQPDRLSDVTEDLAASTNNPDYAAKMLGYDRKTFGTILHKFKPGNGLGPTDNVIWHDNGDVYFRGSYIGNFHDWAD
ncbi:MAG: hypothetical protein JO239_14450 [Paraburkholderia sp.]|nr:hypothetical protein [Paraburkholderia sp.]